jgi:hypothetical protein
MQEFSYEDWVKNDLDPLTLIAINDAPYSEVFTLAGYYHFDVSAKRAADLAWKRIKHLFPKGTTHATIDWKSAYNIKIERELHKAGLATYTDTSASFGWVDRAGNHFGDGHHEYPWYGEQELREALKEGGATMGRPKLGEEGAVEIRGRLLVDPDRGDVYFEVDKGFKALLAAVGEHRHLMITSGQDAIKVTGAISNLDEYGRFLLHKESRTLIP